MRLLYDLDGTLAHFDKEYDRHLEERFAHLTGIPRSADQISFNLWLDRTPEEAEAIRNIMDHEGFYRNLLPMEGAVEAVKEAASLGHEVFFVSAPWPSNPSCAQDKFDWVADQFGEDWRKNLILASDKTIISGDILWDDKDPIEKKERADWVQVFYSQPYNLNAKGLRINSWDPEEWKPMLEIVWDQKRAAEDRWKSRAFDLFEDLREPAW